MNILLFNSFISFKMDKKQTLQNVYRNDFLYEYIE
jgi:hypothetical protein